MKVYLDDGGDQRLIGRADVPDDAGPALKVLMFGPAAPSIVESFAIGAITHLPDGAAAPVVERAVLAAPGQLVHLLPGWVPLAS